MTNVKESFVKLEGFSGYLISKNGEVYNKIKNEMVNHNLFGGGYIGVSIKEDNKKQNTHLLHRLVAKTFVNNEHNKPFVNHKDGNKQNPKHDNLEWCTTKENLAHARKYGLSNQNKKGSNAVNFVLNEKKVLKIRQLNRKGVSQRELAKRFGVSQPNISYIIRNILWSHVPSF